MSDEQKQPDTSQETKTEVNFEGNQTESLSQESPDTTDVSLDKEVPEEEKKVYTEEDFYFDENEVLDKDQATTIQWKKIGAVVAGVLTLVGGGVWGFHMVGSTSSDTNQDPPIHVSNPSSTPAANLPTKYSDIGKDHGHGQEEKKDGIDAIVNETDQQHPTHVTAQPSPSYSTPAPTPTYVTEQPTTSIVPASTSSHLEEEREKAQKAQAEIDTAPIAFKVAAAITSGKSIDEVAKPVETMQPLPTPISTAHTSYTAPSTQTHVLQAGSVIQGTLLTGISTDIPNNEIVAIVRQDVYDSLTGAHILIPQGSKLLGKAGGAGGKGIKRIAVTFDRIILPNGQSLTLPSLPAIDGTGMPGMKDVYDAHTGNLLRTAAFGSLVSAIAQSATGGTSGDDTRSPGQEAVAGGVQEIQQVIADLVRSQAQNQVTIEIRPGKEFSIFVTQDLSIGEYTSEYR